MILPTIHPVDDENLPEFCQFLYDHLNSDRSVDEWVKSFRPVWQGAPPNHGYLIRDTENSVVGGIGAIYSTQLIQGKLEQFCNITSWCVIEQYRSQSMRLAMSLTSQKGYTITDFSPTRVVSDTLRFLKFKPLQEGATVFANLPSVNGILGGGSVLTAERDIELALRDNDLQIYKDHKNYPWLNHIILKSGDQYCHVIYKPMKLKSLSGAKIIYISNMTQFPSFIGLLTNHLLFTKFLSFTFVETRFLKCQPLISRRLTGYVPKNYLSDHIDETDVCYLYSETMCIDLN